MLPYIIQFSVASMAAGSPSLFEFYSQELYIQEAPGVLISVKIFVLAIIFPS